MPDLKVTAYRGDAKTLLAFDLPKRKAERLAGFTVEVRPDGGQPYYLFNSLRFEHPDRHAQDASESPNSTLNAPLHKFRWVHVPGSIHQGLKPFYGKYTYVVTPRYFDDARRMLPLDRDKSAQRTVTVAPYDARPVELGFTRGYVQSDAYVKRFGPKAQIRPTGGEELLFDTSQVAGVNARGEPYTYAQQYEWLGFTAREKVFALLDEVRRDRKLRLDVFAYDLNEPDLARALIDLAKQGRVRMILDNAGLHHSKKDPKPEDRFEELFRAAAKPPAEIKRGRFKRYAHDKVFVLRGADGATKVLTGSTNFSVTGFYVNSNHVLVFDDPTVTDTYARLFQAVWDGDVKRAAFLRDALSTAPTSAPKVGKPPMQITFAPHEEAIAKEILGGIVSRVDAEAKRGGRANVLFAVMAIDRSGTSPVWERLRSIHADDRVFSFGISDSPDGISLYEPRRKHGVLVTGKPVKTQLPPPFNQVPNIGLSHQIHHKFVVAGFNSRDPVVYCGSSNLALGGEQENGDNLLEIHDPGIVTAFTIEAIALVDHFQFLNRAGDKAKRPRRARASVASRTAAAESAGWFLSTGDGWAAKYFDERDLHYADRRLFAG